MLLLNRIRLIAERNAATPAERLLDDLLRLLDASESAYDVNEVQEVQQRHTACDLMRRKASRRPWSRRFVKLNVMHVSRAPPLSQCFTPSLQEMYYRLEIALGAATVPGLAPGSSDIFSAAAVLSQGRMLF